MNLVHKLIFEIGFVLVLILGLFLIGFKVASNHYKPKIENLNTAVAAYEKQVKGYEEAAIITGKHIDKLLKIKNHSTVIHKNIHEYIPETANRNCNINNGFVRLHNDTVSGQVTPPGDTDEKASGVDLVTLGETINTNYSLCRETTEQLTDLQEWINKQ
jgi:hypothetical protein